MFGMGMGELLLILVVALLVVGPDKLPNAARAIGKGIRDFRKQTQELQSTLEQDEKLGEAMRELKSALRDDPLRPRPRPPPIPPPAPPLPQVSTEATPMPPLPEASPAVEGEAVPPVMTEAGPPVVTPAAGAVAKKIEPLADPRPRAKADG
jgi:Tat protein translocase TatB subunit